ncbi:MAG: PAS domain-containing protein [Bacteroidetes bacterium]|nr:PAS domain-containing protein [Bacteroidota bacterium]
MNRSSAARLGIPVRQLTGRILIPFGLLLVAVSILLSIFATNRVYDRHSQEQQVTIKTLFETQASVHSSRNGLAVLSQNRGYERVWILSSTGDILDSNNLSEIGTHLESRWWDRLKDVNAGFVQEDVDFGNQVLSMTALLHPEMGRWVVIVSRPVSVWQLVVLYSGLILIAGLILWLLTAGLIWATLAQKIASPIKKLDERTKEMVNGSMLTEAALERLLAETTMSLGGHATYVVELARKVRTANEQSAESKAQFKQLFDGLPAFSFIRSSGGKIVLCNKRLAEKLSVDPAWIEGQPMNTLKGHIPLSHLETWFSKESASKVGINRVEMFPAHDNELSVPIALTIQPIKFEGLPCHLVMVEEIEHESEHSASGLGKNTDGFVSQMNGSGDGSSFSCEPSVAFSSSSSALKNGEQSKLLDGLMEATGQFVVVFNDDAKTIFWSPAAQNITGLGLEDIPDMKSFSEKVFTTKQERKLFKTWIDGAPDERSQELKVQILDGTVTSRWYASEIDLGMEESVGALWALLDTHINRKTNSKREPVAR